jgi:hypothetical protein
MEEGPRAVAAVKEYLTSADIRFSEDSDEHLIRCGFRDEGAEYAAGYTVHFAWSAGLLKMIISSAFRTPPEARRHAAKVLMGFNWAQQEGAAELDIRVGCGCVY